MVLINSGNYSAHIIQGTEKASSNAIKKPASIKKHVIIFLFLLSIVGSLFVPINQQKAEAFISMNDIKGFFCGENHSFFHVPIIAKQGSILMISAVGGGVKLLDAAYDISNWSKQGSFFNEKRTGRELWGSSVYWTTYRGELEDPGANRVPKYSGDNPEDVDKRQGFVCIPLVDVATTFVANLIFEVTKENVSIASHIFGNLYNPSWIRFIDDYATDLIAGRENGGISSGGLKDAIYFPFLAIAVMLSAVYLTYVGIIKRRSQEAFTSALWMIVAAMVGSVFMFNPSLIPNAANSVVNTTTSAILVGISSSGAETEVCSTNDDLVVKKGDDYSTIRVETEKVIRAAQCSFWDTFIYTPWVAGQWGTSKQALTENLIPGSGKEVTEPPSVNMGGGEYVKSWGLYQLSSQVLSPGQSLSEKDGMREKIIDAVASQEGNTTYFSNWAGQGTSGLNRISVAVLSIVASFIGIIAVLIIGFRMLFETLKTTFLVFSVPIVFLIGVHPGFGRKVLNRWNEKLLSSVAKRILLSVALAILLSMFQVIMTRGGGVIDWLGQIIAMATLGFGMIFFLNKMLKIAGTIDLGSGQANKEPNKFGGMIKGAALGLAGAAVGASIAPKLGASATTTAKAGTVADTAATTVKPPKLPGTTPKPATNAATAPTQTTTPTPVTQPQTPENQSTPPSGSTEDINQQLNETLESTQAVSKKVSRKNRIKGRIKGKLGSMKNSVSKYVSSHPETIMATIAGAQKGYYSPRGFTAASSIFAGGVYDIIDNKHGSRPPRNDSSLPTPQKPFTPVDSHSVPEPASQESPTPLPSPSDNSDPTTTQTPLLANTQPLNAEESEPTTQNQELSTTRVKGKVTINSVTGTPEPLKAARVSIKVTTFDEQSQPQTSSISTFTNERGEFYLDNIPVGSNVSATVIPPSTYNGTNTSKTVETTSVNETPLEIHCNFTKKREN